MIFSRVLRYWDCYKNGILREKTVFYARGIYIREKVMYGISCLDNMKVYTERIRYE